MIKLIITFCIIFLIFLFKFLKKKKKEKHIIKWNDTIKFVPPIKEGFVIKVYDGDTITIATKICNLPNLYRFSVRILDIDCPEINSKDDFEKKLAIKGRDYVNNLILNQNVKLNVKGLDNYGRILAKIVFNNLNIGQELINQKLAIPYQGGKKKNFDWKKYYYQYHI